MLPMNNLQRFVLCAGFAGFAVGCGDDGGNAQQLSIEIHGPDDGPDSFTTGFPIAVDECVESIRFTSFQGNTLSDESEADWRDRSVTLPAVEYGAEAWVSVEGISSGAAGCPASGAVVASGATGRFSFDEQEVLPNLVAMTATPQRFTPGYWYDRNGETARELIYELPGQERGGHTMTAIGDGSGYVIVGGAKMTAAGAGVSGSNMSALVDTIEFYDNLTGEFLTFFEEGCTSDPTTCALRLPAGSAFHAAAPMGDDMILISGGYRLVNGRLDPSDETYVLEITGRAEGRIVPVPFGGGTAEPRAMHTATQMSDGRVVIIGGVRRPYGGGGFVNSIYEVYPAASANAMVVEDAGVALTTGRVLHTATQIDTDGHGIIVVGGLGEAGVVGSSEVVFQYPLGDPLQVEPLTVGGTAVNDLQMPRFGHTAVRYSCPTVDEEFVAIVGGYQAAGATELEGANPTALVEVYIPGARFSGSQQYEWSTQTTTLPSGPRAFASAVSLPLSGDMLVMGGLDGTGAPQATADRLYQQFWSDCEVFEVGAAVGGGMTDARAHATSAVLGNGFVFTTGGQGAAGSLESSEFYNPDDYRLVKTY